MAISASGRDLARGVATAAAMFVALGTLAAPWKNPLFMRMTPAGGFEFALLPLQSVLAGVYVGLPPSACGKRTAGAGAARLAAAVWLKLTRPECLQAA